MVERQCVYVDRTEAIATLDATTYYSCLSSPRRTGKSLLCNQLALWHDKAISESDRKKLFSGTFIGENPSTSAGKYLVLFLDLSEVDDKDVPGSFSEVINEAVSDFSQTYYKAGLLDQPVTIDEADCMSSLSNLASVIDLSGQKLSLIVDEVDSFTNRLFLKVSREKCLDSAGYNEFLKQEGSVLSQFGRVVKAKSNTCIDRMFFTGVMPVDWSDSFSWLNTMEDLTFTKAFENTLGFKSCDIAELLKQLFPELSPEARGKHLESIKANGIGYRRNSTQAEYLYNPQAVWYYVKQLLDRGDQMVPHVDPNVVQPVGDEVAAFLVKHAAAAQTSAPVHFVDGVFPFSPRHRFFSARNLFDPLRAPEVLLSMAHYCGYLSFAHQKHELYGDCLVPSNDAMKEVFMNALLDSLPVEWRHLAWEYMTLNLPSNMSRAVLLKEICISHFNGRRIPEWCIPAIG